MTPNEMLSMIAQLRRERDEAREDLEFRRGLYKVQEECLDRAKRERDEAYQIRIERDEARDALMEIEDRCVDCEDACGDIQKIRDIAVKALEGEK